MSQSKIRTQILTSAAALMLWPALALAQSGSASSPSQSSPAPSPDPSTQAMPSADPSSDVAPSSDLSKRPQQGSVTPEQGSMTSQSQASMPKAPSSAGIDPAEVQKVFGSDVSLIELASLDNEQVMRLQQHLQERGHYQGTIDGIVGPKTRSGLTALLAEQYAMEQRLVNQGQITNEIAATLGIDERTPVRGIDMSGLPDQNRTNPNVQPAPAPSTGQQRSTPQTEKRGTPPATPPSDSRTEDWQKDNDAPVAPR